MKLLSGGWQLGPLPEDTDFGGGQGCWSWQTNGLKIEQESLAKGRTGLATFSTLQSQRGWLSGLFLDTQTLECALWWGHLIRQGPMQRPELWPEASCGGSCLSSGHEGRHRQEHSKDQVQSGQHTEVQANQENKTKTKTVP